MSLLENVLIVPLLLALVHWVVPVLFWPLIGLVAAWALVMLTLWVLG